MTGAAGFIGSHLVDALVKRGHEVLGFDNFATGRRKNLSIVEGQFRLIEGDLRDAPVVAKACIGVDTLFHLGALPSVPRSIKDPGLSHAVNLDGTFNVLEGARATGVRRVVYSASSSAYGNQPGFPRLETMMPQPLSPYAVQKLAGELYMQNYWRVYGMETVCLRYFNIFGPRQVPDSPYSGVIARWILQMMHRDRPTIFGDGEHGRDFTFVADAVQANLRALEAPAEGVAGRVFNVATGQRQTLNHTFRLLSALLDYEPDAEHGPERAGDVQDSLAEISQAREAIGYEPSVTFEDGLRQTVEWYRVHYGKAA